jgi:uncharacterized protein (TIGR03435 family)
MVLRSSAVLTTLTILAAAPLAQQPPDRLEFEVASIKENREPGTAGMLRFVPSGAITARHFRARSVVTAAHELKSYELVGAPEWTATTYYDINAKPVAAATRQQQLAMLRTLLADRFNFSAHRETRPFNGFVLQRVRAASLGPKLQPTSLNCLAGLDASGARVPSSSPPPRCLEGRITGNSYQMTGFGMAQLTSRLEEITSAPVENETGLEGPYEIDLRWSTDTTPLDDVPGIFTAIQEQLGLKLEPRRMQREVLVVDRMERPTPD